MKEILSIFKRPAVWLPLVISFIALLFIFSYVTIFGSNHHEDEGAPARIFQLLMFIQVIIIAFFTIKWLPQKPKQTIIILILQIVAASLPVFLILFFEN